MNTNLFFETILILFAILASNGFIYSFTFFKLNNTNSSDNISVIRNSSAKAGLVLTTLIASNPIRLTSLDSSTPQTLNGTSLESSASQPFSVTSSESSINSIFSVTSLETNLSQDIFDSANWTESEISEVMMTQNSHLSGRYEVIIPDNVNPELDYFTSLDSLTLLDSQTVAHWREIAMDLHELPINTPAGILQQVKFEELNILYSQDIINYGITQSELRLIIEHFPAMSLFSPDMNHLILTVMSYYHI
jgi:hypothetical protein